MRKTRIVLKCEVMTPLWEPLETVQNRVFACARALGFNTSPPNVKVVDLDLLEAGAASITMRRRKAK